MNRAILTRLLDARAAKRACALITNLGDGSQSLVEVGDGDVPAEVDDTVADAIREALRDDRCVTLPHGSAELFVEPFNPPLRMVVVGAVHVAQSLVRFAALTGYDVLLIDPRESFARHERFLGVTISIQWPDEALRAAAPDARTAVVTLTHDPKLDDPALSAALDSRAFYIGALGSRRTHAARLERLRRDGYDDAALARIHGPVGLSIGARSPAEIAIAIMAQVTERLRSPR